MTPSRGMGAVKPIKMSAMKGVKPVKPVKSLGMKGIKPMRKGGMTRGKK